MSAMIAGAHRYSRSLGFAIPLRGLGADEQVNAVEKIFGVNVTPKPDGTPGVRLIATPSVMLGAVLGGILGTMVGPSKGKNYLASGAVGSVVGALVVTTTGFMRSKGW